MPMSRSSYENLPERFYARVNPTPVSKPRLLRFNQVLGDELDLRLNGGDAQLIAGIFSGNDVPQDLVPIAMAYAGHQFGHFVPQLGDGRALLIAECRDGAGARRDIQLKGSGRTPYSRGGDGRAALGPVLREYLASEAMHALGIPSTRALAAVATGDFVLREEPLPGAIVTRVASGFVRVGTFQFFAARADVEAVRLLADYVIARHYPEVQGESNPYRALLQAVIVGQAELIAKWMQVGFIHGVMNTDNMSIAAETIDFGPCAFMDAYDAATVFSSIDRQGRYAYGNQPNAALWNLARFAETLLPMIDAKAERAVELASETLAMFATRYQAAYLDGMRRKLGLFSAKEEEDAALIADLLEAMQRNQADFTLSFRSLCDAADTGADDATAQSLFANPRDYDGWAVRWRARLANEPLPPQARAAAMRRINPLIIPRNHRIEQVIAAAVEADDLMPFTDLAAALAEPYHPAPSAAHYALPPLPRELVTQTFCGT